MTDDTKTAAARQSIGVETARHLATTTKTVPQMAGITPRWLLRVLPWVPVESGTYRVNRRTETAARPAKGRRGDGATATETHAGPFLDDEALNALSASSGEGDLPEVHVDYEDSPREIPMHSLQAVVRVHTRVSDLYGKPIDQLREQLRLTVEGIKERQEWEVLNHADFGLASQIAPGMRVRPRAGRPTPDDLDELLARVWKKPAFFVGHPRAIAAFGRECTRRGVPPPTVNLFGSPFLTWRGVPLVPSDKLEIRGGGKAGGTTDLLLMRVGEAEQGVIGLHAVGVPGEQSPSLSVRFMGINTKSVASYLVTLYFSAAVLTPDALGVLEGVEVGHYHDYA